MDRNIKCGLKDMTTIKVAPRRGAWIEILSFSISSFDIMSHPAGVRG